MTPAAPAPAPAPDTGPVDSAVPDADATPAPPPEEPERLPLPVHARGLALGVIATVAFLYALQWAHDFLVPLLLGIFFAYTLNPVVCWLERRHVHRLVGTTLLTAAILAGLAFGGERLHGEFQNIMEELPTVTHKLSRLWQAKMGNGPSTLERIQAVANELEQAASGAGAKKAPVRKAAPEAAGIKVIDWLWAGSMGVAGFVSQATMVIFLVFFLLMSGDTFKRKLVKLTGPSLTKKRVTVHILEDINSSIQRYMFMLLVTNALLALLMWIALKAIGLENAGAWAIVAGLLHLMPYFGPLLITSATSIVAFLQFESLQMVLLVAGASLGIATLVGTFVTTWMTGRIARMNPAAVFVSLLFWGWLWGVWGLLLGVPVIVIVKVVAERIEGMEVVAELLGE